MKISTTSLTLIGKPGEKAKVIYRDRGDEPPPPIWEGQIGGEGRVTIDVPQAYLVVLGSRVHVPLRLFETKPVALTVALWDTEESPKTGVPPTAILEIAEPSLEWYSGSTGYDPGFLAQRVPLPSLSAEQQKDVALLGDSASYELKYTHFSVVMCGSRRLAYFTAVNIDGSKLQKLQRGRDAWYFDPRIARESQMGPDAYEDNDLDRGHLVRRLDPVWGDRAAEANEDTFHFTNCSPQHKDLNQKTWLNLEDYILANADKHDLRVNVFTGPVFRPDDKVYRGKYQLPAEFWKVVAIVKSGAQLSATAYLQSQSDLIQTLEEFQFGKYKTYQVPVARIEALSSLDFGDLRSRDPMVRLEAAAQIAVIEGPEDILL